MKRIKFLVSFKTNDPSTVSKMAVGWDFAATGKLGLGFKIPGALDY